MYSSILLGSGAINNYIEDGIDYDICIDGIIDLDNNYYNQPSKPIISSSLSLGLSHYWHGLIPLSSYNFFGVEKNFFITRFNNFYNLYDYNFDQNHIFVPRFKNPLRIKNIVKDHIISIGFNNGHFTVNGFYRKYRTKKIYLGLGAYTSSKIINTLLGVNSNVGKDQLCGFLGNIKTSSLLNYISPNNILCREGHLIPFYLQKDHNYILMFRPASFDFLSIDKTFHCRTSFNSGTTEIVKRLSKLKSLGLMNEALYNKFGISFKSNFYNIYFQSGKSVNVLMEKYFQLDTDQSNLIASNIFNEVSHIMPEINFAKINYSPALHLHSTIVHPNTIDNLFITDSSIINNIGPFHHTFITATNFLFNHE